MSYGPTAAQIEWHMHLLRQWMAPTQFSTVHGDNQDLFTQLQFAQTYPQHAMNESDMSNIPYEANSYQHVLPERLMSTLQRSVTEDFRQQSITPASCPSGDGTLLDDVLSCYSETPSSYLSSDSFPEFHSWDESSFSVYNSEDISEKTMPEATTSPSTTGPATEVDALMMCLKPEAPESEPSSQSTKPKKHSCPEPGCSKSFSQLTHLKIHHRSHTGEKPYICGIGTCGQSFSQLGNLRTHERRHFGQKPNRTRAASASGRYECRLDSCAGKPFTQLGNLKSHQNKFHKQTLVTLSNRWASVDDEQATPAERELMEYFQSLYKSNCNRGIKGRGKGRKVEVLRNATQQAI